MLILVLVKAAEAHRRLKEPSVLLGLLGSTIASGALPSGTSSNSSRRPLCDHLWLNLLHFMFLWIITYWNIVFILYVSSSTLIKLLIRSVISGVLIFHINPEFVMFQGYKTNNLLFWKNSSHCVIFSDLRNNFTKFHRQLI